MNVTCKFFAVLVCLLAAALCFSQSGADQTTTLADHIRKAREFLDEQRPDLAIPELQAAVAIDPSNAETQGNLGVLLYFQGKVAEAIPHLRAAVERQPGLGKIQGLLGLGEVHTLEVVRGREDLESAFPVVDDPTFKVQVGLELISLYTQNGDLEEANRVLAQLRKAAPDDPEVLYASLDASVRNPARPATTQASTHPRGQSKCDRATWSTSCPSAEANSS